MRDVERACPIRIRSIADACLYNQQLPQLALDGKTPLQVIKHWCKIKLKLFKTQPRYLTDCDSNIRKVPQSYSKKLAD